MVREIPVSATKPSREPCPTTCHLLPAPVDSGIKCHYCQCVEPNLREQIDENRTTAAAVAAISCCSFCGHGPALAFIHGWLVCRSNFVSTVHRGAVAVPVYTTTTVFALPFSFPPNRDSDLGSHTRSRLFSPLPTMMRALHFFAGRLQPFLPSPTRGKVLTYRIYLVWCI